MKHTFLHLSDLHYRPGWSEGPDLVWKAFCADLATQISHYDDPHLVFSGDLAFAGGAGEHVFHLRNEHCRETARPLLA